MLSRSYVIRSTGSSRLGSTGSPTDGIEVTENEVWAEPEQTAPCSADTIEEEEDAAPCSVATDEQVEEAESPSDGVSEGEEPS